MTICRTHEVTVPRFELDILTQKRTLAHLHQKRDPFVIGDRILLFQPHLIQASLANAAAGVITRADLCALEVAETDLPLLNVASIEEYLTRWNARFPDSPAALRPVVWRIEWSYDAIQPPDPTHCLAG